MRLMSLRLIAFLLTLLVGVASARLLGEAALPDVTARADASNRADVPRRVGVPRHAVSTDKVERCSH